MHLILASGSPRRRDLLAETGYDFTVYTAPFDERTVKIADPAIGVQNLARGKALAACAAYEKEYGSSEDCLFLGADTIVVLDGQPMGKPADEADARRTLKTLSGRTHEVYTGVALVYGNRRETFACRTDVTFYDLTDDEIRRYTASGESMDKAGSYGIQGMGRLLIRHMDGDYFNVVGLPVAAVYRALKQHGILPDSGRKSVL